MISGTIKFLETEPKLISDQAVNIEIRKYPIRIVVCWQPAYYSEVLLALHNADIVLVKDAKTNLHESLYSFTNGFVSLNWSGSEPDPEQFDKKFMYEVRRAGREGVNATYYNFQEINNFAELYTDYVSYAKQLNFAPIPKNLLISYGRSHRLLISFGNFRSVDTICHFYFLGPQQPTLLASFVRTGPLLLNAITNAHRGWINRFLHYQEFLFFKALGYHSLNLGGMGNSPSAKASGRIKFKLEMRPTLTDNFQGALSGSLKGKLFLAIEKLLK